MTPNFTSRNQYFHTLYEFFEKEFACDYSYNLYPTAPLFADEELMAMKCQRLDTIARLFEDEINQTIASGNSHFINTLFQDLKARRETLFPRSEDLKAKIKEWNENSERKFD